MNFSFASAPTTPFIAQADAKAVGASLETQLLPMGSAGPMSAGMATSRATDPINDIGSPANPQYLQFTISQSPFFMSDGMAAIASPSSVALGLPPKRSQPQHPIQQQQLQASMQSTLAPQVQIMPAVSPSSAAAASALALVSHGSAASTAPLFSQQSSTQMLSQSPEDPLAGFSHPLQVFRTPDLSKAQDNISEQNTPNLQLFEDAEAVGNAMRVLSPRTQNAQAGLSLLAASASYAQDSSDMLSVSGVSTSMDAGASSAGSVGSLVESQRAMVIGSPFLNARGENATLMSQPHNSLAQQLSPPMLNPDMLQSQRLLPAVPHAITAGRLTRNRSLLRQSSGLTSASFHNDLVPPANESFFAPLDEVCSENDSQQQQQQQPVLSPATGASIKRFPSALPKQQQQQQRPWLTSPKSAALHASKRQASTPQFPAITVTGPPSSAPASVSGSRHGLNLNPGAIFSQMPSITSTPNGLSFNSPLPQIQEIQSSRAHSRANASDGSDTESTIDDDDDDDDEQGAQTNATGSKRRRTLGAAHKRDQERKFNCDVCHRSFARQYNLKTHRLTHFPNTQESRPFKCPHCPKAFTRKHDLQRHSVLHERKDKHTCSSCNRGFPRKDALKKHVETEHCCSAL
ncbi:hypothetical protein LPJ64_001680 [Coemansia asiatica]|uniref:C2H2-type domain-containing protein n=1 Tax=Coemansia asiatica TaxID=1052880 RepID=A0A9W8CKD3_9FUNG|nr:hypothetical protein LPJ64_001680 [Coemansia asiatica]